MVEHAVSAPGKVLLAGGYLVLDRKHTGLSFGLDARIHVHAAGAPTAAAAGEDVVVTSPQFTSATWRFKVGDEYTLVETSGKSNPFIQTAVSYALAYAASTTSHLQCRMVLTIIADDGYYSDPRTKSNPSDRFSRFDIPIEQVHKTGLGSSAALVTALVAAVLLQSSPDSSLSVGIRAGETPSLRKLHSLAQAAHCAAQGKVGSGFDVASAVYGSCKYRRFSPNILGALGKPGDAGFSSHLEGLVNETGGASRWDHEVNESVAVPNGLKLVMCDVDCGSQTPGMVRDVLNWRKENPATADALWDRLQTENDALASELDALSKDRDHNRQGLKDCIAAVRRSIRQMTDAAQVPIEPSEQTKLIDACTSVAGVLGGVVPGAGGYDAIVLLMQDDEDVAKRLSDFLNRYRFAQPGSNGVGRVKLLDVKGETQGFRVESPTAYEDWVAS